MDQGFPLSLNSQGSAQSGLSAYEFEEKCHKYHQESLLNHFNKLTEGEKSKILGQAALIDFEGVRNLFEMKEAGKLKLSVSKESISPIFEGFVHIGDPELADCAEIGLNEISQGKVACLILAGGDASRLGVSWPKGMFNPGIDGINSIFELISKKIRRLSQLSSERFPESPKLDRDQIVLCIMTNYQNHDTIVNFFKENDYFGYKTTVFFPQSMSPVISNTGDILLKSNDSILMAPQGNGTTFQSMIDSGLFERLCQWNIEYLHITGVDNILNKFADPLMVGLCVKRDSDVVCKYAPKKYPLQKVGVFAKVEGKPYVIEYTHIGDEMAQSRDEKGELLYNHSNLLNFMLRISFLKKEILNPESLKLLNARFNSATKNVQNFDPKTREVVESTAYKFELFVHDFLTFCQPEKLNLLECCQDDVDQIYC